MNDDLRSVNLLPGWRLREQRFLAICTWICTRSPLALELGQRMGDLPVGLGRRVHEHVDELAQQRPSVEKTNVVACRRFRESREAANALVQQRVLEVSPHRALDPGEAMT